MPKVEVVGENTSSTSSLPKYDGNQNILTPQYVSSLLPTQNQNLSTCHMPYGSMLGNQYMHSTVDPHTVGQHRVAQNTAGNNRTVGRNNAHSILPHQSESLNTTANIPENFSEGTNPVIVGAIPHPLSTSQNISKETPQGVPPAGCQYSSTEVPDCEVYEDFDEEYLDPPRRNNTEGPRNAQKDIRSTLEIASKLKPKWDGNPLMWRDFWNRWQYYWTVRSEGMNISPEVKKMIFIESLPRDEAERAMQLIVHKKISFEDLIAKYSNNCASILPRFALERRWRVCAPSNRSWSSIDLWFSQWEGLAANVGNLTEE
jgi:hypothetical protein